LANDQQSASNCPAALAEPEKTRCVACKQEIPAGASICSVCKSYQNPWKNSVQWFAGIATLIVLIFTGCTWLWGVARTTLFYRDDVRLISASSLGSAVVANFGDGEIYVSHLLLTMPGRSADWRSQRLVFEERLPAGQFMRREFPKIEEGNHLFVRGLKGDEFEDRVRKAANKDSCLELVFFSASDKALRELQQFAGPTLNTFVVGGYLEYWGLTSKTASFVPVTGSGAILQNPRPECLNAYPVPGLTR